MAFFRLLELALLLQEDAFHAIQLWPDGTRVALLVVLLAGLATAVGQSVILFVNQIKPRRFLVTLLLSSGFYVFGYLFWSLSIWGVGHLVFGVDEPFVRAARAVGLGYTPQIFAFLTFMPLLGGALAPLLSLWSLLAILVGVRVALELPLWQALIATGGGWLVLQLLQRTLGYPLVRFATWLKARSAGVDEVVETVDPDALVEEAQTLLRETMPGQNAPSSPLPVSLPEGEKP